MHFASVLRSLVPEFTLPCASPRRSVRLAVSTLLGLPLILSAALTINDVSQVETDAGTTIFTFTVSLSEPALPDGVTFDIATADNTALASTSDYVARSLTGQTIPAGNSTYDFSVTVNGDTTGEPDETFFVNVTNVVGDTVGDGQGLGTITNDDSVDLVVTVTGSPDPILAGDDLSYTVTVTNNGTADADAVDLSLSLPPGTAFVSVIVPFGGSATTPAVGANGTVSASLASLAPGGSAIFTIVANVAPGTAGNTILTASATASSASLDADAVNNSGTAATTVSASSDLGISIFATPSVASSAGTVLYTITVTNHGPDAVYPAVLTTLSGNMTLNTAAQPADWSRYDISETELLFGPTDPQAVLADGESAVLTIEVDLTSATPGARLGLHALVDSFTNDPDASNDEVVLRTIVGPAFTPATATALARVDSGARVTGNLYPAGAIDAYSFTAHAGDRVYAATATTASSQANNASRDTVLTLIRSDGSTVLEYDDDDGGQSSTASSIAGTIIPADGTYYLLVECQRPEAVVFPYDLYVRVQSGTPAAANDDSTRLPGQTLPASGWVSGGTANHFELVYYAIPLAAGETLFASLDLDPERDGTGWNALLSVDDVDNLSGPFGSWINGSDLVSDTPPSSEMLVFTVKETGTYTLAITAAEPDSFGNYHLSTTVIPAAAENPSTRYTAAISDGAIPDAGTRSWTLDLPTNQRIGKLKVALNITHALLPDLDIHLTAPDGNTVGLIRNAGDLFQSTLDVILDDDAAYAIAFGSPPDDNFPFEPMAKVNGAILKPGRNYRLAWFAGQQAQGTWTLTIRDRHDNTATGTLNSWSLIVVDEDPLPSGTETTRFFTNFESNDGGFTHGGTNDDWAHGTLATAPIATAYSGTKAWKTNLAGNYGANGNQDLFSPAINLSSVPSSHPVELSWAMKHQLDDASKDGAYLEVEEIGGANAKRVVWRWLGSAMRDDGVGAANETIEQAAGWGLHRARIDDFRGKTIRLRFHLESDNADEFAGLAIDDVAVKSYGTIAPPPPDPVPPPPDPIPPSITLQPASTAVARGGSVTFEVRASGTLPLTYQWQRNGIDLPGATSRTLTIPNLQSANIGYYSVIVTGRGGAIASDAALLEMIFTEKVIGSGTEVATDVLHPNGNIYDQILITGESASTKPNPGQVVRMSFVDLSDDIVQVEFFGAGTLTVTLENATGPAAPANYRQPGVTYMKGHATIEIIGADASSHLTIFSVGRLNAIDQTLFRDDVAYDGVADIALVTIDSTDGKFGGVRTGNVSYFHGSGYTGIYAPGVDLIQLNIGDLGADDDAIPVLLTGAVGAARVAGGGLEQANGTAVEVAGLAHLDFVDGTTSHGVVLPAQPNRARFTRDGEDVTDELVP